MESIKSQLLTMGFHETKINRAIASCPDAKTFEQVMEWLIAHEDELNNEVSSANNGTSSKATTAPAQAAVAAAAAAAAATATVAPNSAGEDNKTHDPEETADNMAARKKITVEEAQRIITERQARRAEEERKKEIEDEKKRRIDGQKMAETRAELQDQERIRLAQQIRREKLEKELHKKSVLEQIARDREAMRQRNNPKPAPAPTQAAEPSSSANNYNKPQATRSPASECKIALRFPDGSNLVQKFSPQEQLSAVRLFVQMEKKTSNEIEFVAPPNKKMTHSMMDETLESLGLCPASRLEVKYNHSVYDELN